MKDVDSKHPGLIEARTVILGKKAKEILWKYLSGSIDKARAKAELLKLLEES